MTQNKKTESKATVQVDLVKLYKELSIPLTDIYPKDETGKCIAVEYASKEITRKGYDTTGYGYQFIVNRLNDVLPKFGLVWRTQDDTKVIREYPVRGGGIYYEAITHLTILFMTIEGKVIDAKSCKGGHQSRTQADAIKGSFTNALKKTAALFGVGADAYEGTIDEDYRSIEEPINTPSTNSSMLVLSGDEMKAIEKEVIAIGNINNKEQLKGLEDYITGLVGRIGGKQIAYLRKLVEAKAKEL